jgi:hypothetical protein
MNAQVYEEKILQLSVPPVYCVLGDFMVESIASHHIEYIYAHIIRVFFNFYNFFLLFSLHFNYYFLHLISFIPEHIPP